MTLKPSDLRARARQHRATAEREPETSRRQDWITLAKAYEDLADEIESSETKRKKTD